MTSFNLQIRPCVANKINQMNLDPNAKNIVLRTIAGYTSANGIKTYSYRLNQLILRFPDWKFSENILCGKKIVILDTEYEKISGCMDNLFPQKEKSNLEQLIELNNLRRPIYGPI